MEQYLQLLHDVLKNGEERGDRTGTGTLSVFGRQVRYNLQDGFPMVTTKKVPFKLIASELKWFLNGDTNIDFLHKYNNHIWDDWADENGNLGNIYGKQWRSWTTYQEVWGMSKQGYFVDSIDQIKNVIEQIKTNPDSRRLIVSAWNPAEVDKMALPPCHTLFQFYVREGKYLDCQLYQRSADIFLGVPFNIASYALLTHMIAEVTGLKAGEFVHTFGDLHLYKNHIEQAKLQLTRKPYPLPTLELTKCNDIDLFEVEDMKLVDYVSHPTIKGDISV